MSDRKKMVGKFLQPSDEVCSVLAEVWQWYDISWKFKKEKLKLKK